MKGTYSGASAIVIPSLCDSLKCLGQNWKYAVPSIPFIPMTYPQNRWGQVGTDFTRAGYERVIADLERATGARFDPAKLTASIKVYSTHNAVMRRLDEVLATHAEIIAAQRSDIFKSAFFMKKEEHTAWVEELLAALEDEEPGAPKIKVMTTGILCDSPGLLEIFDDARCCTTRTRSAPAPSWNRPRSGASRAWWWCSPNSATRRSLTFRLSNASARRRGCPWRLWR